MNAGVTEIFYDTHLRIIGSYVTGLFQKIQERTKALVLVFVFVLVDEQAISIVSLLVCDHVRQIEKHVNCVFKGVSNQHCCRQEAIIRSS